ncbi:MAG: MBOAT family protein [Clostridia bacterium]|nr:MBOAT family protein [Clostridia bacterium]
MNFNSLAFLIYLPAVVGVHWLLPHRFRRIWLLLASYFFYMYWNPLLILLLIASTAVDYCCGRGIEKHRGKAGIPRLLLLLSVCMNLGMLFFFKYWDFFGEIANGLFIALSIPWQVPALDLILPVGISFYTFQTMSYTIDVYRGDAPAEKNIVTFALYVSFFPQLVAGPIENPGNLMPQLKAEHRLNREDLAAGCRLLLCGFFRKCVVADLCGIYVNAVYAGAQRANGLAVALAGALFCIQMYCDFAGYSEIAAGAARLMGVRLMRNFDRPYLAQSYGEFFRRWHISLNRWFTSYVYIPLGGGRRGPGRKILNTLIVFTLCGLWHGARWTYILWGLYAAFWVCLEALLLKKAEAAARRRGIPLDHPVTVLIRRAYMFLIFLPAALLFRAESTAQAGLLLRRLFTGGFGLENALDTLGLSGPSLIALALTLAAMARIHVWGQYDLPPAATATARTQRTVSAAFLVVTIALSWLALLSTQDAAVFAYFQF